jgi:hypothetical protein
MPLRFSVLHRVFSPDAIAFSGEGATASRPENAPEPKAEVPALILSKPERLKGQRTVSQADRLFWRRFSASFARTTVAEIIRRKR